MRYDFFDKSGMYILSAQLDSDATAGRAFARYQSYLSEVASNFPSGALRLATSDWYFDSSDHRAPHDAWLEAVNIVEDSAGDGVRRVSVELKLLGAYRDGQIVLRYRDVTRYRIELEPNIRDVGRGLRDWRYDEFRLGRDGGVEHEIEWWASAPTGSWLIEAADVQHEWHPIPDPK